MKITKSQLRKMIKEELSSVTSFGQTDMSVEGIVKRAQKLYDELARNRDKFASQKLTMIYNDLQDVKTKHSKEKGKDEGYETLMRIQDAIDVMLKAVKFKQPIWDAEELLYPPSDQ